MQIKKVRSTSKGLKGTLRNANCHAKKLLPDIKVLMRLAQRWGFASWVQAHNVHRFDTHDGRMFTLKPKSQKGVYKSIQLFIIVDKKEVLLASLHHDEHNGFTVEDLSIMLRNLAREI